MSALNFVARAIQRTGAAKLPLPPNYLRPFYGVDTRGTMTYPVGRRNPNAVAPCFRRVCAAGSIRSADVDMQSVDADTKRPLLMRVHRR